MRFDVITQILKKRFFLREKKEKYESYSYQSLHSIQFVSITIPIQLNF